MSENQIKFDIDESQIKVNPLVDGALRKQVQKFENFVNTFDHDKNGVPDIQQYGLLAQEVVPALAELSESIDFKAAAEFLAAQPFVKNKAKVAATLIHLGDVAEKAGKLVEAANASQK